MQQNEENMINSVTRNSIMRSSGMVSSMTRSVMMSSMTRSVMGSSMGLSGTSSSKADQDKQKQMFSFIKTNDTYVPFHKQLPLKKNKSV